MQTTEIKEQEHAKQDYRKEITALNKRLQAYRAAYIQAAWEWLQGFIDDLSNITDEQHGYWHIRVRNALEDQLRVQFPDLWNIQRPYSQAPAELVHVWRTFYTAQIEPINEALQEHVKAWWCYAWRTRLDFKAIPPAPEPIPTQFQKVNQRTHRLGQITVTIGNELQWREVHFVDPGDRLLYSVKCYGMTVEACRKMALPIAKRLARLGDWSRYLEMTAAGQRALLEKLKVVAAYEDHERWAYKNMRRALKVWKPEEEVAAILQAEKDRHAIRHN